jgi:nucleoside-diphosphate-sugar epimerase
MLASSLNDSNIETESALDELLTCPGPALVEFIKTIRTPLLLLGAGGKMGPTLAVMAQRAAQQASHRLEILAASRFSDETARRWLEDHDVRTICCDLMDRDNLRQLPDAEYIIYLVGLKFGTTQNPASTWAINTLVPANVCARYPHSQIAALSSGSIYPLVPIHSGGAAESEPLTPLGEYANACVARERIFEYFSRQNHTPIALLRLFYAVELRYGVLVDIAQKVYAGEAVDLTMGYLNWIWQGDANDMILRSLALASTPPTPFNLTGSKAHSIRDLALQFGELLGKRVCFTGREAGTALLGNTKRLRELLGEPAMPAEAVIRWIAQWIQRQGRTLGKPTHFEVRDGRY